MQSSECGVYSRPHYGHYCDVSIHAPAPSFHTGGLASRGVPEEDEEREEKPPPDQWPHHQLAPPQALEAAHMLELERGLLAG